MPDWQVQQLRVSLYSSSSIALTEEKHWMLLTGQREAENRLSIPGGRQYVGKFLDSIFNLAFYVQRCDILETEEGLAADPSRPQALPTFGAWDEALDKFLGAVRPFVAAFEFPVIRLAFGAILLAPAASREDSYRMLGDLVQSITIDPINMRELVYRVNWPRESSVIKGLELNRITTWNSIAYARGMMQVGSNEISVLTAENPLNAARLDMDFNTNQIRKEPFEPGTILPILEELVSLARDTAKTGEHP